MKIAILIREFESLSNWELRIVDEILKDPNLDLSLLIKDGRSQNNSPNSSISRFKRALRSGNLIGKILYSIHHKIESFLFKQKITVDKKFIKNELSNIEQIYLSPKRKGFLDIFSSKDSDQIKAYNIDIILRHEFNIIKGEILDAAKYGIWSFHHGDNSINRGGPPGFWEIVLKNPTIGVTLQKLTPELDGGYIIDKAFYNIHWSFVNTRNIIYESSVVMLFKNIKKISGENLQLQKSTVYYNPLYKIPKPRFLFKYLINFYSSLFEIISRKIQYELFGIRYNCWTLFIGEGNFFDSTLFRLKPTPLPKHEFWADPFILNHKGNNYAFFENYNYKKKKGKISCGKIINNEITDVVDVIENSYHLSFPFIFKHDNEIFLMPESEANNRLEIYKCIDFPSHWELHATAFEGEKILDPIIYTDKNNNKWLFLNKVYGKKIPMNNSELYIYKINSMDLSDLIPHKNNPVIIDSRVARNGGPIFEYQNQVYRPSQVNVDGIYGKGLNVNKINKLTIDEYVEETVITTYPNFKKGLSAMHHLHQSKGLFIIDAAYKKY